MKNLCRPRGLKTLRTVKAIYSSKSVSISDASLTARKGWCLRLEGDELVAHIPCLRSVGPSPNSEQYDPKEVDYLSPGHFLIDQHLLAVPEIPITPSQISLSNRWKLINQCAQAFWRRWRDEYLQTLQTRGCWTADAPNLAVNDIVIIKDPHSPPLVWRIRNSAGCRRCRARSSPSDFDRFINTSSRKSR